MVSWKHLGVTQHFAWWNSRCCESTLPFCQVQTWTVSSFYGTALPIFDVRLKDGFGCSWILFLGQPPEIDSIMGLNKFVCIKAFKISVKQGSLLLLVQSLTWALGLPNQGWNWLWCCQQIRIRLTCSTLTGSGFLRLLLAAHAACGTSECL